MKDSVGEQIRDLVRLLQDDDAAAPFRVPIVLLSRVCESLESRGERLEFAELRGLYDRARAGEAIDRAVALGIAERALDARNRDVPPDARVELFRWPR